jgi:hypothetical protein
MIGAKEYDQPGISRRRGLSMIIIGATACCASASQARQCFRCRAWLGVDKRSCATTVPEGAGK